MLICVWNWSGSRIKCEVGAPHIIEAGASFTFVNDYCIYECSVYINSNMFIIPKAEPKIDVFVVNSSKNTQVWDGVNLQEFEPLQVIKGNEYCEVETITADMLSPTGCIFAITNTKEKDFPKLVQCNRYQFLAKNKEPIISPPCTSCGAVPDDHKTSWMWLWGLFVIMIFICIICVVVVGGIFYWKNMRKP